MIRARIFDMLVGSKRMVMAMAMVMVVLVINTFVNFYKDDELFKIIGKRRSWCLLGQNS